eukprot:5592003-Alexandrium_andersonii.AAC.1
MLRVRITCLRPGHVVGCVAALYLGLPATRLETPAHLRTYRQQEPHAWPCCVGKYDEFAQGSLASFCNREWQGVACKVLGSPTHTCLGLGA